MTRYRYTPQENGCFIVHLGEERIGWVFPAGTKFRASDTFMVPLRGGYYPTRKAAADALARAFDRAKARGDQP